MSASTVYKDSFARDHLPPEDQQPDFINLDQLAYPERLNAATALLDGAIDRDWGDRIALISPDIRWSYRELLENANRIANVLTHDLHLVTGERVLLRGPNEPMLVAAWFGVLKAGGIAVTTMPLLRTGELSTVLEKAQVRFALCDERIVSELHDAVAGTPVTEQVVCYNGTGQLEAKMREQPDTFDDVETASDDVAIIAFTSGTTGNPKGTMHFHRDLMTICRTFSERVLSPEADDIFLGSPPIAFTFGLGGQVLFPLHAGAATVLLEKASPPELARAIENWRPTITFTSPTAYRVLARLAGEHDFSSLTKGVSAGETLPLAIYQEWVDATGIKLIDGLGSTELLHIFITSEGDGIRPGATGKPVPLYEARILDHDGNEAPVGEVGRLAVRGPTGCRYLADERQRNYVVDGWNVTGDAYRMDEDGFFWFHSRNDDMIISAGYNISGPEVEDALLIHPGVAECACVAWPDSERGHIVKAFVVAAGDVDTSDDLVRELQDHVKKTIAPYKYPRAVEFVDSLPKTETGKIQRFRLRELAQRSDGERA